LLRFPDRREDDVDTGLVQEVDNLARHGNRQAAELIAPFVGDEPALGKFAAFK
jgi:hypothetical protein